MIRILTSILFILAFTLSAAAEEKITSFDAEIAVQTDGDIVVTETIALIKEGRQINRGIKRDFVKSYIHTDGTTLPFDYDIISVKRDGRKEPYSRSSSGNAVTLKIGDADVILSNGPHTYEIKYEVKNQVRYFSNYDEVYWNVTGSQWTFPIDKATARITLPTDGKIKQQSAYTGGQGSTEQNYRYDPNGSTHTFTTTQSLAAREGLSVAIGFEKGIVDPPSAADNRAVWWMKHGALLLLSLSSLGILGYYIRSWNKVGRDPAKGAVFARYEPPQDYSPAAVHRIFHKGLRGHKALIASLINLSIDGKIELDAEKKATTLTRKDTLTSNESNSFGDEALLFGQLFPPNRSGKITLDKKYNSHFYSAYKKFKRHLERNYSSDYHKFNVGYIVGGMALTALAVIFAAMQLTTGFTSDFLIIVVALIVANIFFAFLMPAPTEKGQETRTEIEGFKLYLETAEKLQLNAAETDFDTAPPMSVERYEKYLPYAVALGVEKPWTKQFERLMPKEAKAYNPTYTNFSTGSGSLSNINRSLVSNINSGVSRSMPQSSSSSGSGGGGFSGGGGGGGGGSGW